MDSKWLLLTWLSWQALSSAISTGEPARWFRRSDFLDPGRLFHMEWETGDSQEIVFKLEIKTLGYVALGFSRDGTMVDSDFVVGWVSEGQVYLQDRYAEGKRMPELDKHTDYELISGSENATHTTLVFKRKWDTCDRQDFTFEYDNTIRVIHGYSYEDPVDEVNLPLMIPSSTGWKSLMLLQPEMPREKNVQHWDLLTNEMTISTEWDTLYWCKLFKTPDLGRKHHITAMEPLLLGGNGPQYVHHVIVYECANPDPSEYEPYLYDDGYDCSDLKAPSFTRQCDGYFTVWGRGGEGVILPEHIGFALESNKYMMLQIHYDNFNRETGVPGRAGMRFSHTPRLRRNDGGLFTIGIEIEANVMAPPGVRDFVVAGHANPDCTSPVIPPEGVMMHSTTLHTHLIGSSIKNRHFRNNIELRPLANNKHYDSGYQQPNIFDEERLLLPNDQLTLECTYDSINRNRTTFGGLSTREEMCSSLIVYYPRFPIIYGSRSLPPEKTTTQLLGSKKISRMTAGGLDYDQTFVDLMADYDWNRTAIRWFGDKLRYADHDTFCNIGTGNRDTVQTKISYPKGLQEYIEPDSRCPKELMQA